MSQRTFVTLNHKSSSAKKDLFTFFSQLAKEIGLRLPKKEKGEAIMMYQTSLPSLPNVTFLEYHPLGHPGQLFSKYDDRQEEIVFDVAVLDAVWRGHAHWDEAHMAATESPYMERVSYHRVFAFLPDGTVHRHDYESAPFEKALVYPDWESGIAAILEMLERSMERIHRDMGQGLQHLKRHTRGAQKRRPRKLSV